MTPDANVLVAAFRADHPHHAVARDGLSAAVGNATAGDALTLMPMVLASFLRLVTSARVFQVPAPVTEAVGFVDALLAAAGVRLGTLGAERPRLRRLCVERQLAGNALPAARLAAATQLRPRLPEIAQPAPLHLARSRASLNADRPKRQHAEFRFNPWRLP